MTCTRASLVTQSVNSLPAIQETWVGFLGREDFPWRRKWQPTPVFLPGESHGQRSLAGYNPWGHKSRTQLSEEAHSIMTCSSWNISWFCYPSPPGLFLLLFFVCFFFRPSYAACGILGLWPGIKSMPPALRARSLNHCTTREVPITSY